MLLHLSDWFIAFCFVVCFIVLFHCLFIVAQFPKKIYIFCVMNAISSTESSSSTSQSAFPIFYKMYYFLLELADSLKFLLQFVMILRIANPYNTKSGGHKPPADCEINPEFMQSLVPVLLFWQVLLLPPRQPVLPSSF